MKNFIKNIKSNLKYTNQTSYTPIYRVIEIQQDDKDNFLVLIQLIGKNSTFHIKPEEILSKDELVNLFSPVDIRTLTYLGYLGLNSPQYKILAQRAVEDNKTIFILKKKGEKEVIIKSAEEIMLESEIIADFDKIDTKKVIHSLKEEENYKKEIELKAKT